MNERLARVATALLLGGIGLALLAPNVQHLLSGGPAPSLALAGLGSVVALVVALAGALVPRAGFNAVHTLRIAGWAVLGTAVLGLVLALIAAAGVTVPLYAAATLLSVSTFAHVLIGVRDVQRIRAEALAREREKLDVLNRLVRHNLRHVAQLLLGQASRVEDAAVADEVEGLADRLSGLNDVLERSQSMFGNVERRPVDVREVVEDVLAEYRETHPEAAFETDLEDCRVLAVDQFRNAVAELVENAVVHDESDPRVRVACTCDADGVQLRVEDTGPGIPAEDRAAVTRSAAVSQLEHSQGLGLWFVRWVMDASGGDVQIDADENGSTVTLSLSRAGA